MKTILVTGGAGFIGSHTCLALLNSGFDIIVLDSFLNSSNKVFNRIIKLSNIKYADKDKRIMVYKGDIRDESILNKIFKDTESQNKKISCVIHFAGLKSVSESNIFPLGYWDVNVGGTINLLKLMEKFNCYNFVFSSSATVYGKDNINPNENSPKAPINPYGETKLAVESILNNVYRSSPKKWRIIVLRYFNPIGAHHSGLLGEDPFKFSTNVFPDICKVALGKKKEFSIFGNDWPTCDGTGVRDYIHVMDLAEGHIAAMQYLFEHENQIQFFNLGTGIGTSVLELVDIFEKSNSCKVPYKFVGRRNGDAPILVANNELAIAKLKWIPKRDIKLMCKDSWKWCLGNPNGF